MLVAVCCTAGTGNFWHCCEQCQQLIFGRFLVKLKIVFVMDMLFCHQVPRVGTSGVVDFCRNRPDSIYRMDVIRSDKIVVSFVHVRFSCFIFLQFF